MHRQRGITLVGWLVLLIPLTLVVYAGIRLIPVYLNYMNVSHTLEEVASEYRSGGSGGVASIGLIRDAIGRHFEIDEVNYPTVNDIAITRDGAGWQVEAAYYDYAPLFGPLSIQVKFDKSVTFGRGG